MQCNKKSAEKVAEKQLKQKQSKAEAAFGAVPTALGGKCRAGSPPPRRSCAGAASCCGPTAGTPGGEFGPQPEGSSSLLAQRHRRAPRQGETALVVPGGTGGGKNPPGGFGRRRDAGRRQAVELSPRSGDWDHNSSEQGYGIFNEYAYYQGGDRGGEKIKAGILQRWYKQTN